MTQCGFEFSIFDGILIDRDHSTIIEIDRNLMEF